MTRRCLESVKRALSEDPRSEGTVILVDNGSVERYDHGFDHGSVIETVRLDTNQGFARGMNAALRAAFASPTTQSVVALSNDIELPSDFYTRLALEPPASGPEILCPQTYYLSDREKPAYTHGILDLETSTLSHHFDPGMRDIRFPAYFPAAATVWSRGAFEKLGGFDERYFCYWEDVELSHRAHLEGVTLRSVAGLRVHHLGRGTTGGKRIYSEHFRRGQELTMALVSGALVQSI